MTITYTITSAVITGGTSIPTSASSVDLPVGAALGWLSVFFSLLTITTQKSFKTLTVKQGKHNTIKLLAQGKLDSMANIISQAMQDGNISPTEFLRHIILWSIETIKSAENLSFQYVESTSGPKALPVLLSIIVSSFITVFF